MWESIFIIGKLDNKNEKSIGIYQNKHAGSANIALGGLEQTKTQQKQISILIHWNQYANETEEAAQKLYDNILNITDLTYSRKTHKLPQIGCTGAYRPVGDQHDKGIYERVIWLSLFYER